MLDYLLAFALILLLLLGWIGVQHCARRFAARHPEFGPAKEEGSGCGAGCSCASGSCAASRPGGAETQPGLDRGQQGSDAGTARAHQRILFSKIAGDR